MIVFSQGVAVPEIALGIATSTEIANCANRVTVQTIRITQIIQDYKALLYCFFFSYIG